MLTHVDKKKQPTMVDISEKKETARKALAQSQVQFPPEMKAHIRDGEIYLNKGPVFQTALIAGTMAVKKTADVVPFCHQIAIESCKFSFTLDNLCCTITCEVATTAKTGVEMEALHGAMIAALTVYDMCKALSHRIEIKNAKLISKTGGKHVVLERPLYGLVLTGGKSSRMKRDKALIDYKGKPHAQYIFEVLQKFCSEVYLSAQEGQWARTGLENLPTIEDCRLISEGGNTEFQLKGPMAGILSAFEKYPDANWLIVACDLIHFNEETAMTLIDNFKSDATATCFTNDAGGFPEALCAIYTPKARQIFLEAAKKDLKCPVKILSQSNCHLIGHDGRINLANINSESELAHEIR